MTENRNFKRLVRQRMASTGERYATARSRVLAATAVSESDGSNEGEGDGRGPGGATTPGLFPAVRLVGGQQPDLAAARNLLLSAGVSGPGGQPMSEAMAFGLAGGIGFLYGVFQYAEGPTMTIVARAESMPDPFCEPLFARAGATIDIATTGGAKKAAATLDRALDEQQPVLCTVGSGALPYLGEADSMAGMAPHIVGVVGRTPQGQLLLDDRSPEPLPVDRAVFDKARAAYNKAKHRMITVTSVDPDHPWSTVLAAVVRANAANFDTPPVPQFAANVGRPGLAKFQRLVTAPTDQKGWNRVFADGRSAAIGLSRLHDCIEYAYTAPAAGRPLYADFLDEVVALAPEGLTVAALEQAAQLLRDSGEAWSRIASLAAGAHPDLMAYVELSDRRAGELDATPAGESMAAWAKQQQQLVAGCDISAADAGKTYRQIGQELDLIVEAEGTALELLGAD